MTRRVTSFSLVERRAWLDDEREVPITNIFGTDREETDDPDLAWSFVAGSDETGWFSCFMSDYVQADLN